MRRGLTRLLPCSLLLLTACGPPPTAGGGARPLVDHLHAPELLTEGAMIEVPPASGANRFVRGWQGMYRRGRTWMVPSGASSVIETVFLDERERRLSLLVHIWEAVEGATVGARVAGIDLEPVPVTTPIELPLPGDLPLGRQPIELDFGSTGLIVEAAGFTHAWREGAVRFEPRAIVQQGYSAVDLVRRLPRPATLVGRFEPPADPLEGDRFALMVETADGAVVTPFEWRPSRLARLLGSRRLRIRLPAGLVRVRLLAQGLGPAGRWLDLALASEPAEPAPLAPPPEPPRLVVLYVMSGLRADALGHLGGELQSTPTLDRLAAEGVSFDRYYSTAPDGAPALRSLVAGLPPLPSAAAAPDGAAADTLGRLFGAAGFRTAAFTAGEAVAGAGLAAGFEAVGGAPSPDGTASDDGTEGLHAAALAWLDGLADGERAFAYLHTSHPGAPYAPPAAWVERMTAGIDSAIDGSTETLLAVRDERLTVDEADRRRLAALYRAALAYNDATLGELVAELDRRYAPGEVLLVVTSAHGEELFDHGGVLHGSTLYEELLHVPLLVWWPERLAPRRVAGVADHQDLNATLRTLAGAAPAPGGGRALWGELRGRPQPDAPPPVRFAAAAVEGGLYMAAGERYKLILAPRTGMDWGMGLGAGRSRDPEYVFDLVDDPRESRNLAGTTALEVAWLRARLNAWIESGGVRGAGEAPDQPDRERRVRPAAPESAQ